MKPSHLKSTTHAFFAALLMMTASSQAANVLLLADNFDTANNTSLNNDLGTRQAGTLAGAGSTWSEVGTNSAILSNQLNVPSAQGVVNAADFEGSLTSAADLSTVTGFIMAFKLDYTGTVGTWTSPYLSTHNNADERANSRFGMVAFGNGAIQFYGDAPTTLDNTTMAGLVSGWSVTNQNSYSLVATRITATSGVYDAFVNGVEVASNMAYTFGTGGTNGQVNFQVTNVANGAGIYDDFSLTTIPEPGAAFLGSLGLLALVRRRR